MDGWKEVLMGILDLYLRPKPIDNNIKSANLKKLTKQKSKRAKILCDHIGFHYEKWIHRGAVSIISFTKKFVISAEDEWLLPEQKKFMNS